MTQVTTLPAALEVSTTNSERYIPVSEATARRFSDAILGLANAEPADDYLGPGEFLGVINPDGRVSDSDDRVVAVDVEHVALDGYVTKYAFSLAFARQADGSLVAFNPDCRTGGSYPTWSVSEG